VSPVLATSRAGNFVRAILTILVIAVMFREIYLLWFFHTGAWTSRPKEIRWCGQWYQKVDQADVTRSKATDTAGGPLKTVTHSPVFRPVMAYKPGGSCPDWAFAKVGKDRYVAYLTEN
jgi:hypothetical protein